MQGTLELVHATEAHAPTTTANTTMDSTEEPQTHNPTTLPTITPQPEPFTISDLQPSPQEPLYTEINIPLPQLQKPRPSSSYSTLRNRAHSLHPSFKPFHRRGSSSDSSSSTQGYAAPRPVREEPVVKSREVAAAMDLRKRHRRSRTVDALAVVPAVLILRAELFTPGEVDERSRREVKWEDGMI